MEIKDLYQPHETVKDARQIVPEKGRFLRIQLPDGSPQGKIIDLPADKWLRIFEVSMFACPICDQNTCPEDPQQELSTFEICQTCGFQSGYEDGGGSLAERQKRWPQLREKYKQDGKI